jgi:phage repressor protein C with HTH and peptisase S24 domain
MTEQRALQLRLDQVLHSFGSVADLARRIGVSDNAIYKWLSGRGQPSVTNLIALARVSKVSIEWLATGQETLQPPRNRRQRQSSSEHENFDYVTPYDAMRLDAGGVTFRSDQVVDYLAFKKEWLHARLDKDPRNLLLIEIRGDSMTPTLKDSDLLLVDLGEPHFGHDGIYVLRRENELEVRRLQRRGDGSLNVICDNSSYPSAVESDGIQIIGRVIWAGGRL